MHIVPTHTKVIREFFTSDTVSTIATKIILQKVFATTNVKTIWGAIQGWEWHSTISFIGLLDGRTNRHIVKGVR